MTKFNLTKFRRKYGLSQSELARMIDTPITTLNTQEMRDKCTGAVKHACLGLKARGRLRKK